MKITKYRSLLIAAPLLTLVMLGCSSTVDHTIAGGIKKALPTAIGPAQSYSVVVNSDPLEAAKGHLREVDIVGTDVNLSPQLLIDELDVSAKDIKADVVTQKVKSVGDVTFMARIGQDSINHYLASQPPDSAQRKEDLRVTINNNSVTATVQVKALGISVPASVSGTFAVEQNSTTLVDFIPNKGSLAIIQLPEFALKFALDQINPVIDLSRTNIPVAVNSVTIQSGTIVIHGSADLQPSLTQNT